MLCDCASSFSPPSRPTTLIRLPADFRLLSQRSMPVESGVKQTGNFCARAVQGTPVSAPPRHPRSSRDPRAPQQLRWQTGWRDQPASTAARCFEPPRCLQRDLVD